MTHTDKQPKNTTNWQDAEGGGRMQLSDKTIKEIFPATDKQPQTCYIECFGKDATHYLDNQCSLPVKKVSNVYLFTPAELEAMKADFVQGKNELLNNALKGLYVLKTMLSKCKLNSGVVVAIRLINDIETDLGLPLSYPLPQPPKK